MRMDSSVVMRLCLLFLMVIAVSLCARADVSAVRIAGNGDPTRITIYTNDARDPAIFLTQDTGGGPGLVAVLGAAEWHAEATAASPETGVSGTAWDGDRIKFSFNRPMMVARTLALPPAGNEPNHRIILDLSAVSPARFKKAASSDAAKLVGYRAPELTQTAVAEAQSRAKRRMLPLRGEGDPYVIVIDPGHGGKDPGALANGAVEKEIVLKAALQLRDLMATDPRYEVRLTRGDDRFIELEDRPTLARQWNADLFISIHADSAGKDAVGASVYTLSASGERRIDGVVRDNNWILPIERTGSKDVSSFLEDMLKRETKSKSEEFAHILVPELAKAGPLIKNTHRNKGLYVLLAPDVPAVLLELGYLTNPADARRLKSDTERKKIMVAVKRSIDRYFDHQDVLMAHN